MNCREYRDGLIELARKGAPGGPEQWAVEAHAAACARCAAYLEAQRELSAMTGLLAATELPSGEAFADRVMAEFDRSRARPVPAWRWTAAAAAAAGLCAVGAWVAGVRATPDAPKPVAAASDQPFLSIPYTVPLAPNEPASLVRARIPVSQLIAAGFHVSAAAADPRAVIEADVLVGQDGRARAIRPLSLSISN